MRRLGVGSWISRELWDDSQSLPVQLAYLTYGAKWGGWDRCAARETPMNAAPILVERLDPDFATVWMCEPPSKDVGYYVISDEWNADYTERRIYEIRPVKRHG